MDLLVINMLFVEHLHVYISIPDKTCVGARLYIIYQTMQPRPIVERPSFETGASLIGMFDGIMCMKTRACRRDKEENAP